MSLIMIYCFKCQRFQLTFMKCDVYGYNSIHINCWKLNAFTIRTKLHNLNWKMRRLTPTIPVSGVADKD